MKNITSNLLVFFCWGIFFFTLNCCFFFYNLNTYTSPYSSDGVSWTHQIFYNFLHDRAFQTSLFASVANGSAVGYSFNPHAYLHIFVVHSIISPIIFAYIWSIFPNIEWLYGSIILIGYLSFIVFTFKTLKIISPKTQIEKSLYAIGFLLSSGYLYIYFANAQPLLLSTPFILGAYFGLMRSSKFQYMLCIVLLCLMSEDAVLIALGFSVYIYFFEKNKRNYAFLSGLFSVIYLFIIILLIQPASRFELTITDSTTILVVLKKILDFDLSSIYDRLFGLAPALFFTPAFLISRLYFGKSTISGVKLFALITIPSAAHWGESFIVGAGHHLVPVLIFLYIGLILQIGNTVDSPPNKTSLKFNTTILILFLLFVFIACSTRILASNVPSNLLIPVLNNLNMKSIATELSKKGAEGERNKIAVEIINKIPKNKSISLWTNASVIGFVSGRSDIWQFPDYYDKVDFLIIQPEANHSAFEMHFSGNEALSESIKLGKINDNNLGKISKDSVNEIVNSLVNVKKTHTLSKKDSDLVVLERLEKSDFEIPPSTLNFGWINGLIRIK